MISLQATSLKLGKFLAQSLARVLRRKNLQRTVLDIVLPECDVCGNYADSDGACAASDFPRFYSNSAVTARAAFVALLPNYFILQAAQ